MYHHMFSSGFVEVGRGPISGSLMTPDEMPKSSTKISGLTALRQNPPRHETGEASQNVLINGAHQRTPVTLQSARNLDTEVKLIYNVTADQRCNGALP